MKEKRFKIIITTIIVVTFVGLALFVLQSICSKNNCGENVFGFFDHNFILLFFNSLNVVVLSFTLWRITETNTINDKRLLSLEKKEILEDVKKLEFSLNNKTILINNENVPLIKMVVNDKNYNQIQYILLNWIDDFSNIINEINECKISTFDKRNIYKNIGRLYELFNDYYNTIPNDLLLYNGKQLEEYKERLEKKLKKRISNM